MYILNNHELSKMTTQESKHITHTPSSQPISILATDGARFYTHVHPILLLSYYYLRFPVLVATPIPTLLFDLLPLSILQTIYIVSCLPPQGFPISQPSPSQKSRQQVSRKRVTLKPTIKLSSKILVCLLLPQPPSYSR